MTDLERLKDIKTSLEKQCMLAIRSTSIVEDKLDIEKTYRSQIQTFENAISALEKQIPKKTVKGRIITGNDYCPVCHHFVQPPCEKYCSHCGQALLLEGDTE